MKNKKQIPKFNGYKKVNSLNLNLEVLLSSFTRQQLLSAINEGNVDNLENIIKNNEINPNLEFKIKEVDEVLMRHCIDNCIMDKTRKNIFSSMVRDIYDEQKQGQGSINIIFLLSFLNKPDLVNYIFENNKGFIFSGNGLDVFTDMSLIKGKENSFLEWAVFHDNLAFLDLEKKNNSKVTANVLGHNLLSCFEVINQDSMQFYPKSIYKHIETKYTLRPFEFKS